MPTSTSCKTRWIASLVEFPRRTLPRQFDAYPSEWAAVSRPRVPTSSVGEFKLFSWLWT